MISVQVARIIADFYVFLESADEDTLDPDTAVQVEEVLADNLQSLDKPFLRELVDAFAVIAPEYGVEGEALVREIAYSFYLEEELASDDPVRLAELNAFRDSKEV
jgi:hypothetical protein